MKRNIELLKLTTRKNKPSKLVTRTAVLIDFSKLDLGGVEGNKFRGTVELPRSDVHGKFFFKEYPYQNSEDNFQQKKEYVEAIFWSYVLLRKKGYPVPQTVRMVHNRSSRKIYLVMSDMTQGEKYRVWGSSGHMTSSQDRELKSMQLFNGDLQCVFDQAQKWARKAAEDSLFISRWSYHIIQHKNTRQLSICLLDVDGIGDLYFQPEGKTLLEANTQEVTGFERLIWAALA